MTDKPIKVQTAEEPKKRTPLERELDKQSNARQAKNELDVQELEKALSEIPSSRRTKKQILEEPEPVSVIEEHVWMNKTNSLIGESGACKTFIELSRHQAITTGKPWLGKFETTFGSTVYVSWEDDSFNLRLIALEKHGTEMGEDFNLVRMDSSITSQMGEALLIREFTAIAAEITSFNRPPVVYVSIDTVRLSMDGSEDSSGDVSKLIRTTKRLVRRFFPEAAISFLHHTGWQDSDKPKPRERGSSALRGNVDNVFLVQQKGKQDLLLRSLKIRDGEESSVRLVRRVISWKTKKKRRNLHTDFYAGAATIDNFQDSVEDEPEMEEREFSSLVIELDTREANLIRQNDQVVEKMRDEEMERRVLKVLIESRLSTKASIRSKVKIGSGVLDAVMDSLKEKQFMEQDKKGAPYLVTEAGKQFLNDDPEVTNDL